MATAAKMPAPVTPANPTFLPLAPLNMGVEEADFDGEVLLIGPVMDEVGVVILPIDPIFCPTCPNNASAMQNDTN